MILLPDAVATPCSAQLLGGLVSPPGNLRDAVLIANQVTATGVEFKVQIDILSLLLDQIVQ